jgi:hypothetical protein
MSIPSNQPRMSAPELQCIAVDSANRMIATQFRTVVLSPLWYIRDYCPLFEMGKHLHLTYGSSFQEPPSTFQISRSLAHALALELAF